MRPCPLVLILLAACEHPAAVVVEDASASRTPDGHVQVDVLVTGVEQSGGFVGHTCVAAHWLGQVDANVTDPAPTYLGEIDVVSQCFDGLGDGDRRFVRLTSNRAGADLPAHTPIRCQAAVGPAIRKLDIDNP
jgi:hypothetical protein